MAKAVRGRFFIAVNFPCPEPVDGWTLRIESDPKRSLDAADIVRELRKYADLIESSAAAGTYREMGGPER